jgi:uncharacterized phage-like protein YoqJ
MKVILLGWGDYQLGVFSNKEKADEAEAFYAKLEWFADPGALFWQDEYELNSYSDEKYLHYKIDNSIKQKIKSLLGTGFLYLMIILFIICLGLGIESLYTLIIGQFKSLKSIN